MIDITQYRAEIGCFCQPRRKIKFKVPAMTISKCTCTCGLRALVITLAITLTIGGVEQNPGPGPQTRQQLLSQSQDGELRLEKDNFSKLKTELNELKQELGQVIQENVELKDRVRRLEDQSRRDNLMFFGIPETTEGVNESWEDCENSIKESIELHTGIDKSDVMIERAHRVGKKRRHRQQQQPVQDVNTDDNSAKARPVIVKFASWKQKTTVLQKMREAQQGKQVKEDFSQEVRNTRRKLSAYYETMKAEHGPDSKVFVNYDKLCVKTTTETFVFALDGDELKRVRNEPPE